MAVHALAVSTDGGPCAIVLRGVRLPVMLPIAISAPQAAAIAAVRFQFRRPLTHDLACNVLTELRATAERVVIHDVQGSTFIARLEVSKDGQEHIIDSRPSDAIALAVRLNLPVIVTSEVLSRAEGVRWGKEGEEADGPAGAEGEQSRAEPKRSEPEVSPEQLAPFKEVIETLDLENL
ncbi:MAG TPA: bifunctional nuclease family protein [Chloroflexota bacterium]|nr:bifunctional nuclease family protein [Chloroflexota bacterium]